MSIGTTDGYMDMVKTAFLFEPELYTRFLDLMTDYCQKRLNEQASGFVWEEVAEEVSRFVHLLRNHPQLILGFNLFLPTGMKLSMEGDLVYISYNGETKLIEGKKEEEQVVEKKASFIVGGDDDSSDESINDDWDVVDERSEDGNKETLKDELGAPEKDKEIHNQQSIEEEVQLEVDEASEDHEEDDSSEDSSEHDVEEDGDESDQSYVKEEGMELEECDDSKDGESESEVDEVEELEEDETHSENDNDAMAFIEREQEIRELKRQLKRTEEDKLELRVYLLYAFMLYVIPYLISSGQSLFSSNNPAIEFHAPATRNTSTCAQLGERYIDRNLRECTFKIDIEQPWATISGDWSGHRYLFHQYSFLTNGTGSSSNIVVDWDKPHVVTTTVSKVFNVSEPIDAKMELFAGLRIITSADIRGIKDVVFRHNVDCTDGFLSY